MKKSALIVFFLFFANLHALYLGNPYSPASIPEGFFIAEDAFMTVKAGYQVDFVYDRRLKSYAGANARVDQFQAQLSQGVLTFDMLERIEIYGSVGSIEAIFSHRPKPGQFRREYQTNYKVTWGVGGRIIIYEWTNGCISLEGGFQWGNPHIKWDALNGSAFTTDAVMRYREWQTGIGVSYQVDIFIPYAAFKFSDVNAKVVSLRPDLELKRSHFKMRNRDHFGLVFGCTLSPGKYFDVTIESRVIDEQAITLAGNIQF